MKRKLRCVFAAPTLSLCCTSNACNSSGIHEPTIEYERNASTPSPTPPLRTLRVLRGRGQNGGRLDGGWRIALSLFAEPATPVSTERLPPPWGRGGTSLEKGERLFQGNPGWGQQATRAAPFLHTPKRSSCM